MKKTALIILDGWGHGKKNESNAIYRAKTPYIDSLYKKFPNSELITHGEMVGLPKNQMGNSEVGHNAMGAGRVFDQGAKLVANAISSGNIWDSPAWKKAIQGNTLHLIGMVSDGNVHSHIDHLHAMILRASSDGVKRLRVHGLTDGRDVGAKSALTWFEPLEALLKDQPGDYKVGSGGGRMHITMDRYEADWPMVERGWNAHTQGLGRRFNSACEAIQTLYTEHPEMGDQYLPEFVVGDYDGMHDGDSAILFNFRGDRAVEICQAFDDEDFPHFERGNRKDIFFAGMMQYDGDLKIPQNFLVHPPLITNTVGEQLEAAGLHSLAISETQKFGHVTYFFNGNRGEQPAAETWNEIPSLNVPFDQAPEMCAVHITNQACTAITSGQFDHVRINIANGDMVGHTGALDATVAAVEHVDDCVGSLIEATRQANGILLLTADHGNADQMFSLNKKTGEYAENQDGHRSPHTSHSLNPVPVWLFDAASEQTLKTGSGPTVTGGIAQIGGTILHLFGIPRPKEYLPSLLQD